MLLRFLGLIAHVEENNENLAVLMQAPAHLPILRVPRRHQVGQPDHSTAVDCYQIRNRTITFSGPPAGPGDRSGLAPVLNLTALGAGPGSNLHPNVRARRPDADPADGVESMAVLPDGTYGVEDWFETKAVVNGSLVCVPRTVTYDVTATSTVVVNGLPGLPGGLQLKPTAIITFTNIEPRETGVPHFRNYERLFDPPVALNVPGDDPTLCPDGDSEPAIPKCSGDGGFSNLTIQCANTGYP